IFPFGAAYFQPSVSVSQPGSEWPFFSAMTRKDFMYVQITLSIWPIEGADTMDRASPGSNTDPAHETAAAISKLLDVPLADLMNVRFRSPKRASFQISSM